MPTKIVKTVTPHPNKKRRASRSPKNQTAVASQPDSDDEETEFEWNGDALPTSPDLIPTSPSKKKAKIQPSDDKENKDPQEEEQEEDDGADPPEEKEGEDPPAAEESAEEAPAVAAAAAAAAEEGAEEVPALVAAAAGAEEAPAVEAPVVFRSFASPVRNGSNPYYVHFQLVNRKLVSFYLSRSRFGNAKTYANHVIRTAVQKSEAWIRPFNISDDDFFLHVDGELQPHFPGSRYNKRCFMMDGIFDFKSEQEFITFVRPIALKICEEVNKRLNHDSKISVPQNDLELIRIMDDSVMSDVIGMDSACEKLLAVLGESYEPSKFEKNRELIYSFFRAGSIPRRVGAILGCSESDMEEAPVYN